MMEPSDQDDIQTGIPFCVKSEPCMDNYKKIELEDSRNHTVKLKPEANDMLNSEEVDLDHVLLESDDFKLEPMNCTEFECNDALSDSQDTKTFIENYGEYNGIYYEEGSINTEVPLTDSERQVHDSSMSDVIKLHYDETVHFLSLYAGEKVLYDTSHEEYNNKDSRLLAAERISEALNIPGLGSMQVMQTVMKLRKRYCEELKKLANSEKLGEIYKPKVFWFEQVDSFIRPFVKLRFIGSNKVLTLDQSKRDQKNLITSELTRSPSHSGSVVDNFKRALQSTFKRRISSGGLEFSSTKLRKVDCSFSDHVQPMKKDCYDYFGSYIASLLRSLESNKAMKLQQMITSRIIKAKCSPTSIS